MRLRRAVTREKLVRAGELRAEPTPAEAMLWKHLRRRGVRFARQVVIQGFIVDFCCRPARLIIEVDGGVHDAQVDADRARDAVLRGAGYRVVRFTNEQVMTDPAAITAAIMQFVETPWPSPSGSPSP